MLQRLLVERFQLSYHFEKRQVQAYNLVIAKGGLKMRESPPPSRVALGDPGQPDQQRERRDPKLETDADGYPIVQTPPRESQSMAEVNGRIRWTARDAGMETIVALIASYMDGPVTDLTSLQGRYDLTLSWGRERDGVSDEGVPTLVEAIQKLLGLKLDKKKQFVDVFVVDHVETRPIGN